MHILAFILLFILASIGAACKGDWSGFEAMGKFILYFAIIAGVLCMIAYPQFLVIAIIIIVLILMTVHIK